MKCHRRPPDGMENVKEKVFDQFSDPDWMIYKRNPVRRLKLLPKLPSDSSILHFISPNEIWNVIYRQSHSFQSGSTNPTSTFELVILRKGFNLIISCLSFQSSVVFDLLKAHLKRAPSLRGAALVRLASLKFQAEPWPPLIYNKPEALARLDEVR